MSTPIEMRKYLAYMRSGTPIISAKDKVDETKNNDMTMRDMLGKMRKIKDKPLLNLNEGDVSSNQATGIDQSEEESKIRKYFYTNNVTIEFQPLEIFPTGVIFGGTIDGQIQFVYKVTHEEATSGVEVNYLEGFDAQDPENEEVIKKVEDYYNVFYKYWRHQLFDQ